jgi:hypothetical protein
VEPAWVGTPSGSDYKFLVGIEDEVVFPHVDVCMAIAFILSDGRMVAGHVPGQWDAFADVDKSGNASRILREMNVLRNDVKVQSLVTMGDADWSQTVAYIRGAVSPDHHLDISKDIEGGADLSIAGNRKELRVIASRTGQLLAYKLMGYVLFRNSLQLAYRTPPMFKKVNTLRAKFQEEASKSLLEEFDATFFDKVKRDELQKRFQQIFKKLGPCARFDLSAPESLESNITFHFNHGQMMRAKIKIKERARLAGRYDIVELEFEGLPW